MEGWIVETGGKAREFDAITPPAVPARFLVLPVPQQGPLPKASLVRRPGESLKNETCKNQTARQDVWHTQDFTVHHDLPCINREICIVETPIELFTRDGLVRWVVVRRYILMCQGIRCTYPFSGIKDKHFLQEIKRLSIDVLSKGKRITIR